MTRPRPKSFYRGLQYDRGISNPRNYYTQAISSLGSQVYSQTFGHSLSAEDLNAYLTETYSFAQITEELSDRSKHFIVACDSQRNVVGFAQLTEGTLEDCIVTEKQPVELQRLYVHSNYHGLGIGKCLIQKIEELARQKGFQTLWLGVWEQNYSAQKVYEKMGFVKVGQHGFKMGKCVQTDHIMKKYI